MYYTVYRIRNEVNGTEYIGAHQTENLEDGYFGSGKILRMAVNRYGLTSFVREVVAFYSSPEAMYNGEASLISEALTNGKALYNIHEGGFGGWAVVNANLTEEKRSEIGKLGGAASYRNRNTEEWKEVASDRMKRLHREGKINHPRNTFQGRTHSDITKERMSVAGRARIGDRNSQYGTHWKWIHREGELRKIPASSEIPDGWLSKRK